MEFRQLHFGSGLLCISTCELMRLDDFVRVSEYDEEHKIERGYNEKEKALVSATFL